MFKEQPLFDTSFTSLINETFDFDYEEPEVDLSKKPKLSEPPLTNVGKQDYMKKIGERLKAEVMPMAKYDHPATADDVYQAIIDIVQEAHLNKHISDENYDKIVNTLNEIRRSWAEDPDSRFHRIGSGTFESEKDNLASYAAQWFTAGSIGSSTRYDPKTTYHLRREDVEDLDDVLTESVEIENAKVNGFVHLTNLVESLRVLRNSQIWEDIRDEVVEELNQVLAD